MGKYNLDEILVAGYYPVTDKTKAELQDLIEASNKSAYQRGYDHGYKIGYDDGLIKFEPDTNIAEQPNER